MRVCMILEGSYPYVHGGVSSWMHQYIEAMPDTEFVLWCIGAKAENKGVYKYKLPENVKEVNELFLDDALRMKMSDQNVKLTDEESKEIMHFFDGEVLNWDVIFNLLQNKNINPIDLLMSEKFISILLELCENKFPYVSFTEFFYNVRSMLLPELYLVASKVPKADIYHSTATGYSGLLGSLAKWKTGKPFIVTEHGIYTREREEELLRAKWVVPYFRKQWIDLFYSFSSCAYSYADKVTSLFENAKKTEIEIGCLAEKCQVIENGIHYENFGDIPVKTPNGFIDIAAVVRIAKIKDIKTMIYAFAEVREKVPNARLFILGDVDDEEYFEDCKMLVDQLSIEGIDFTGMVKVSEFIRDIDYTILTSISEGQPLSVLESFAAARPVVCTDVGCCRDLIEGKDGLGSAGICVPPMDKDSLAQAMIRMCLDNEMRLKMGEIGRERAHRGYTHEISMDRYRELYKEVRGIA